MAVTRESLYQLVWSQPMTKIAAELGVSGSYLARVCAALRVPRPERGYWAKAQVGKAKTAPALPVSRPGDLLEWTKSIALRPMSPLEAKVLSPIRRGKKGSIGTHALIAGARKHFESGRPVNSGEYLRPLKKLLVDVTVSAEQLLRALALANELFNALDAAGYPVTLGYHGQGLFRSPIDENEVPSKTPHDRYPSLWTPSQPTLVHVGEVSIGLSLVELSESVLMRYVNGRYIRETDYRPPQSTRQFVDRSWTATRDLRTGRFRLIAYAPQPNVSWSKHWQEDKSGTLLQQVPDIIAAMPSIASLLTTKTRESELERQRLLQQWRAEEERRKRDADREMTRASIRASHDELESIIKRWANVISVEQFLQGVSQRAADLSEMERAAVLKRLSLARDFLGSLDPLQHFLDWRTPLERYSPLYNRDEDPQNDQHGD